MSQMSVGGSSLKVLNHNSAVFARLVQIAEERVVDARHRSALEWCRVAASFAMTNATGEFRSGRLEQVADVIARQTLAASPPQAKRLPGRRRVLHVVSEARSIGGLTRMAERWIQRDAESVSSVVVTLQPEVHDHLRLAAEASGGQAIALGTGDTIELAQRLRNLGEESDIVVCHLHPADPVPAVAFGEGYDGAPVALFNHSDHLFWWAPTKATLVVDFRAVGTALTLEGRGYPATNAHELPLLVPRTDAMVQATRDSMGFRTDSVVALTVARDSKFRDTPLEPHFSEMLATALDQNPALAFCAVGPDPSDEPWPALLARYPGRIRVEGPVRNPQSYYQTADIYLDTYPFSSLTSLLEASSCGLPVLTYDGHSGLRRALGIADFVATEADRPNDLSAYYSRLTALVRSPRARLASGEAARASYDSLTPDELWLDRAHGLYSKLQTLAREGRHVGDAPPPAAEVRLTDHALALLAVEQRIPLVWMFGEGMPLFDEADRTQMRLRVGSARAISKLERWSPLARRASDRVLIPRSRPVVEHARSKGPSVPGATTMLAQSGGTNSPETGAPLEGGTRGVTHSTHPS